MTLDMMGMQMRDQQVQDQFGFLGSAEIGRREGILRLANRISYKSHNEIAKMAKDVVDRRKLDETRAELESAGVHTGGEPEHALVLAEPAPGPRLPSWLLPEGDSTAAGAGSRSGAQPRAHGKASAGSRAPLGNPVANASRPRPAGLAIPFSAIAGRQQSSSTPVKRASVGGGSLCESSIVVQNVGGHGSEKGTKRKNGGGGDTKSVKSRGSVDRQDGGTANASSAAGAAEALGTWTYANLMQGIGDKRSVNGVGSVSFDTLGNVQLGSLATRIASG
jgi:hypothetical protein